MPTSLKGLGTPSVRATKAWHDLAHESLVQFPKTLASVAAMRRRLLRVRPR